jgi:hypothetical protein
MKYLAVAALFLTVAALSVVLDSKGWRNGS